jgi:hypothetical protein
MVKSGEGRGKKLLKSRENVSIGDKSGIIILNTSGRKS